VTILAQRFQEFHSTVEPAVPIISYDVNLFCVSVTLFVYRTCCCFGLDQLIDNRLVARGSRHKRPGGKPGEMESVSRQTVTKLTGERERWTSRSGLSMLAFPKYSPLFACLK
jgi:hypothetical protein